MLDTIKISNSTWEYLNRWIFTTNCREIAILYLIFAVFSGLIGTGLSIIIRLELAGPSSQILRNNGAPNNNLYSPSDEKLITNSNLLNCIKHLINWVGANLIGKIAYQEKRMKDSLWAKFSKVRITNLNKSCLRVLIPCFLLENICLHSIFYIVIFSESLINIFPLIKWWQLRNLNWISEINENLGSPEIWKYGGDGTLILPH